MAPNRVFSQPRNTKTRGPDTHRQVFPGPAAHEVYTAREIKTARLRSKLPAWTAAKEQSLAEQMAAQQDVETAQELRLAS